MAAAAPADRPVVATSTLLSMIAGHGLFADDTVPAGTVVLNAVDPVELVAHGPLNHSCDPSLGWDGDSLVTLRPVAEGAELTVDYATCVDDPELLLRCHCETYRCRQLIEGDDWRIPQLQRRYAGHWATALQRRIDAG